MLSRFHPILGRYGRTNGQMIAISILRVSVLTRDKMALVLTRIAYVLVKKLHRAYELVSKSDRICHHGLEAFCDYALYI